MFNRVEMYSLRINFWPVMGRYVPSSQDKSTKIKCDCLDMLYGVHHRFGNLMATNHEMLLGSLLPQLGSNKATIRKKTISCLGMLLNKFYRLYFMYDVFNVKLHYMHIIYGHNTHMHTHKCRCVYTHPFKLLKKY